MDKPDVNRQLLDRGEMTMRGKSLGDKSQRMNDKIMERNYGDIPIKPTPGVSPDICKGFVTVKKFTKPVDSGIDFT